MKVKHGLFLFPCTGSSTLSQAWKAFAGKARWPGSARMLISLLLLFPHKLQVDHGRDTLSQWRN